MRAAEAVSLALEVRAPIRVIRELLEAAGISSEEVRGFAARHQSSRDAAFRAFEP